jgi:hypothetical protein
MHCRNVVPGIALSLRLVRSDAQDVGQHLHLALSGLSKDLAE